MSEPSAFVGFESDQRVFRPGEILSGHYRVDGIDPAQLEALELSVLWHTEGKGDEDLAVHLFQRFMADETSRLDGRQAGWFSTQLPPSPLSYEGRIVKIRWCVRVRLFLSGGREIVREEPFQLGDAQPETQEPTASRAESTSTAAKVNDTHDAVPRIEDSREADFTGSRTLRPEAEET